jgi:DNA-directed RNA polymerase subunit alpha
LINVKSSQLNSLLHRTPFDDSAITQLLELLKHDPAQIRILRETVATMREHEKPNKPEAHLRLGIGEVLLGRYFSGLEHLRKAGDKGMAFYFRGIALENQQLSEQAAMAFAQAAKLNYDPENSELRRADSLRRAGQTEEAKAILDGLEKLSGSSAEYHFQRGCLHSADGDLMLAKAEFEKALGLGKEHTGALFELAYINDLYGNDDLALEFYQRCTDRPPVPLAAWINLGILYEDEMRFRDAEQCYRHVLAHEPNHPRARLFFKDCLSSKGMYYDEEAERCYTVLKQLHEIPVTDFELSVRSRNCLRKMNIRTLGDLTRTTELALLSSKNFGETSMAEIKDMMQAKGLRLGMSLEGNERAGHDHRVEQPQEVPPELQAILNKPIGDLTLSVRARKCLSKLNIQTVGDLLKYTGDELLEYKDFGVKTLSEVRERLADVGLYLSGESSLHVKSVRRNPEGESIPPPLISHSSLPTQALHNRRLGTVQIIELSRLEYGESIYQFNHTSKAVASLTRNGLCVLTVDPIGPRFTGRGKNVEEALEDWGQQIHVAFQTICKKDAAFRTKNEHKDWQILTKLIDVNNYIQTAPFVTRRLGRVSKVPPAGHEIEWLDGRSEEVNLKIMPPEYATYSAGQWFEAIVDRDPVSGVLRKVRYVQCTPALAPLDAEQLNEFWRKLPTTAGLPKSSRDWTRR